MDIGTRSDSFTYTSGKNIYNPNDSNVATGFYVDGTNGVLVANASYKTTGFIEVIGGSSYALSYKSQLAWYDINKIFISGSLAGDTNKIQVAPSNAKYLRAMLLITDQSFQVENGTSVTAYEPYSMTLKDPKGKEVVLGIKDATVTLDKLACITIGKNLFNKDTATKNTYIDNLGGVGSNTSYLVSTFIAVKSNTQYYGKGANNMRFVCYYDANKIYVSGGLVSVTTFTPPTSAVFVRITVFTSDAAVFQLEAGGAGTAYEPYNVKIIDSNNNELPLKYNKNQFDYTYTIAATSYIPYGKEFIVYKENIAKRYLQIKDRISVGIPNAKELTHSTKITPTISNVNTTIVGTVNIYDEEYVLTTTSSFNLKVSDPTKTTAINIQNIGDSFTGRMTWADVINASAGAANITWSGNRNSAAATPSVMCEGQGGWTIVNYFTVDSGGALSPFMQPVTAPYKYYGLTSFWIDANSSTPSYNAGYFTTLKVQFDATTGRKKTPAINDIMGEGGGYIVWDGSAWVSITSATFGGFAFSYGKYRSTWAIPAPTFVHILLGTNDFVSTNTYTFANSFSSFKTYYDQMIASIKADTPTVKILIGIPTSSGRQGEYGIPTTEARRFGYNMLANEMNKTYGGREAESLYLIDYHSGVDRVYGFSNVYETPFADYSDATGDDTYKADYTHPSVGGFKQMGNLYMGAIQWLR
jgi:hypothetical protein